MSCFFIKRQEDGWCPKLSVIIKVSEKHGVSLCGDLGSIPFHGYYDE
jgi:hypothetical protein